MIQKEPTKQYNFVPFTDPTRGGGGGIRLKISGILQEEIQPLEVYNAPEVARILKIHPGTALRYFREKKNKVVATRLAVLC